MFCLYSRAKKAIKYIDCKLKLCFKNRIIYIFFIIQVELFFCIQLKRKKERFSFLLLCYVSSWGGEGEEYNLAALKDFYGLVDTTWDHIRKIVVKICEWNGSNGAATLDWCNQQMEAKLGRVQYIPTDVQKCWWALMVFRHRLLRMSQQRIVRSSLADIRYLPPGWKTIPRTQLSWPDKANKQTPMLISHT